MSNKTVIKLTDVEQRSDDFYSQLAIIVEITGEQRPYGLDDNGGFPDGDAWILPEVLADSPEGKAAIAAGAVPVTVYTADYDPAGWDTIKGLIGTGSEWTGMSQDKKAWFTSPQDALHCQVCHDQMGEDDNLETIYQRVIINRHDYEPQGE